MMSDLLTEILTQVAAVVRIVFALVQWLLVSKVKLLPELQEPPSNDGKNGHNDYLIEEEEGLNDHNVVLKCADIRSAISEGATSFLFMVYRYVRAFIVVFAILIFFSLALLRDSVQRASPAPIARTRAASPFYCIFSTVAFLLGAITTLVSGLLGMKIATYANAGTTLEVRKGVGKAFIAAFYSGSVMGFLLAANGLLVLYIAINLFKLYFGDDWEGLFEAITGYGLGGSLMAVFRSVVEDLYKGC